MNSKVLEDDIVRRRFRDSRVHAVLDCASVGCPRLPRRAFEGATLDAAMREFCGGPGTAPSPRSPRGRGAISLQSPLPRPSRLPLPHREASSAALRSRSPESRLARLHGSRADGAARRVWIPRARVPSRPGPPASWLERAQAAQGARPGWGRGGERECPEAVAGGAASPDPLQRVRRGVGPARRRESSRRDLAAIAGGGR